MPSENDHHPMSHTQTLMSKVLAILDLKISPMEKYISNIKMLFFVSFQRLSKKKKKKSFSSIFLALKCDLCSEVKQIIGYSMRK